MDDLANWKLIFSMSACYTSCICSILIYGSFNAFFDFLHNFVLGKYALMLHAMSKHCSLEEEKSLKEAEGLVKFQLRHGNDLLTMDSIRDCDVNLKEQGNLLRQVRPSFKKTF